MSSIVGYFGFNGPSRQFFSLYRAVSQRGRKKREMIEERKMPKQPPWGGRVVRWCWINFQGRDVKLIWIIVRQGPPALAVDAGGGCLDICSLICYFSFLPPPLSPGMAR